MIAGIRKGLRPAGGGGVATPSPPVGALGVAATVFAPRLVVGAGVVAVEATVPSPPTYAIVGTAPSPPLVPSPIMSALAAVAPAPAQSANAVAASVPVPSVAGRSSARDKTARLTLVLVAIIAIAASGTAYWFGARRAPEPGDLRTAARFKIR